MPAMSKHGPKSAAGATHALKRSLNPFAAGKLSGAQEAAGAWTKSVEPEDSRKSLAVEPLLVPEEIAAEMLGVSARTVWKLGKAGAISTARIGRRKMFSVQSLKAYATKITEVR